MKTHSFGLAPLLAMRAVACAVSLLGVCIAGCADTHWERAFYQGARYGNEQCELKQKPTAPPCTNLPDYDRYERERAKAKNEEKP